MFVQNEQASAITALVNNKEAQKQLDNILSILTNADDMRSAFEQHIQANPHDPAGHMIYADYLEEHGHPDEAHERRRLGMALGGSTDRRFGLTPHLAWQHAIKASRAADVASQRSPDVVSHVRGYAGGYRTGKQTSQFLARLSRGPMNEMTGETERPYAEGFRDIAGHHQQLAQAYENAGHHDTAKAHRIAALAHQVASHVHWSKEEQEVAEQARRASSRAYRQDQIDSPRDYADDVELHSWLARDAANRAAHAQGTLAAHRSAITSHQETIAQGSDYPQLHEEAIAAHRKALRMKSRRK